MTWLESLKASRLLLTLMGGGGGRVYRLQDDQKRSDFGQGKEACGRKWESAGPLQASRDQNSVHALNWTKQNHLKPFNLRACCGGLAVAPSVGCWVLSACGRVSEN